MRRNPIYIFKDQLSTGIIGVPLNSMIHIQDSDGAGTPKIIEIISKNGLAGGSTIANFLADPTLYNNVQPDIDSSQFIKIDGSTNMSIGYEPTDNLDVATKMYVDDNIGSGGGELIKDGVGYRIDGFSVGVLGSNAVSMGHLSDASGQESFTEGHNTTSSGSVSHAEGANTTAGGDYSHAEGYNTDATGYSSHTEGYKTNATGEEGSHAEGYMTSASGDYGSHAEGIHTVASGDYGSHAEGKLTTASGDVSHAEGVSTTASGAVSHAEGVSTTASGAVSHAEGLRTEASDEVSHAEGVSTTASGKISHAEGYQTTASGKFSHAEGYYTTASGEASHAAGRYNIGNATDTIHETGIGADNNNRKNAFEIYTDGRIRAPELTTALITDNRSLITKEYLDAVGLNELNDVTLTNIQDEDYIKWDAANNLWINAAPQTVAIDDLSDVDTTTSAPVNGQVLKWDGTNWVPQDDEEISVDENEFTATASQTNFVVLGKVFLNTKCESFTNGLRDSKTTYTVSDNGTDTTVEFTTGKNANDIVDIVVY